MLGVDPATGQVPDDPADQVDLALDRMKSVLEAAGLDLRHMVFVNPYLTEDIPTRVMNERYARRFEFGNTPARATIEVSSLPGGAHIEYTGVAVRDLAKARRPPEEHAAQSNREPVRLCRQHSVLLGEERIYSRRTWRRLRKYHRPSTAPNNAQSAR